MKVLHENNIITLKILKTNCLSFIWAKYLTLKNHLWRRCGRSLQRTCIKIALRSDLKCSSKKDLLVTKIINSPIKTVSTRENPSTQLIFARKGLQETLQQITEASFKIEGWSLLWIIMRREVKQKTSILLNRPKTYFFTFDNLH